jgi:hypothetical protein
VLAHYLQLLTRIKKFANIKHKKQKGGVKMLKNLIIVILKVVFLLSGAYFIHLAGIVVHNVEPQPVLMKDLFDTGQQAFYYITLPLGIGLGGIFLGGFLEQILRLLGYLEEKKDEETP